MSSTQIINMQKGTVTSSSAADKPTYYENPMKDFPCGQDFDVLAYHNHLVWHSHYTKKYLHHSRCRLLIMITKQFGFPLEFAN